MRAHVQPLTADPRNRSHGLFASMGALCKRVASALLACGLAVAASGCGGSPSESTESAELPLVPAFPLHVSANGRYLVDQNNAPFPIFGDAGWEVSHNLTTSQQTVYIQDRAGRGFNAVLQEAIDHKFTNTKPPKDIAGNLPFTKRLDSATYTGSPNGCTSANGNYGQFSADPYSNISAQAPDFTYPNEAYWARLDSYVSLCAQNSVVVFLFPSYVGWGGGDEGWMGEMVANDAVVGAGGLVGQSFADNSKTRLWNYGAWLGNRYKNATNIVWVSGGDYGDNPSRGGVFTTAQKNAVNSIFAGIKSVAGQQSVLHTAHWARGGLATNVSLAAGAFDLESVYADTATAQWARAGYANTPVKPAFEIEDYYEGTYSGNPGEPFRRFHWWEMLSDVGGLFAGTDRLWQMGSDFSTVLDTQGARDNARLFAFMRSLAWYKLVPSGLSGMKVLVTSGGGTESPQSTDYVAAAAAPDGSLLIAYVPPAHAGSIGVDMSAMAGSTTARWFNPTTAVYTSIGTFPNAGTQTFTPPGDNGSGFHDWVLVLTSGGGSNTAPTIATAASATPSPVGGLTTSLSVLGADDGGEAQLNYGWSTVGTPPASVAFSPNGSNAAKAATATFGKAGSYTLRATVTDSGGLSASSDVTVTVNQTLSSITVAPATASIAPSTTQQFAATAKDQFEQALGSQPTFAWSVSGCGTISGSGLFTAGSAASGPCTVTASASGKSGTASVSVGAASFMLKINFQTASTVTPAGYLPDTGLAFGDRGNGYSYGWNVDNTAQARERNAANSPDKRYDTFDQFQRPNNPNGSWEIAVPNGTYSVRIVAGDPSYIDSVFRINAENTLALSGTPTDAQHWIDSTVTVTVSDGRLSLTNAAGSTNNKINFIELSSAGGSGNQAPTVSIAASASPNPVSGLSSTLSVLGADDGGESSLTYTWAQSGSPIAPVSFSPNASNGAKNSTVSFDKAGAYSLSVTLRDAQGLTATSTTNVTVSQTLTNVAVSPTSASLTPGGAQQFTATALDQFDDPLSVQPAFGWSVNGCGTISASGLFTAGSVAAGPCTITASTGSKSATASVSVSASSFFVRINFQMSTTVTPAGYLADLGLAFGNRGNGYSYGWNIDNTAQARERNAGNSPDKRYDTLNQFQRPNNPNGSWEIALPNGSYSVRIVAGDPSFYDAVYRLAAENVLAIDGTPSASTPWFDATVTVTVSDGRLTLSNASGSLNNKINFIEITGL